MNNTVDHLATASRFAIAAAIIYFAYQLGQLGMQLPAVMQSVDEVSQHIEPTLDEITEIRKEITEVRELIPGVLAEVTEVRRQIPPILAQVESINQQIDPIMQQVDKTVAVINATQQQIPQILSTADNAIVSLDQTRAEVVPLMPQALEEVRLTRETINPTLDRVEDLVEDAYYMASDTINSAKSAGQEASEGAVKGFFTGLVKLPFQLVGSLASPIVKGIDAEVAKQLTEKDLELMVQAGNRAVASRKPGKERRWENPDSGNSGTVEIIRKFELQGFGCIEARVGISNKKKKQILDKLFEVCKNAEDKWVLAKNLSK